MEKGDALLLFTDGITEAWQRRPAETDGTTKTEMFGYQHLQDVFEVNGKKSPAEIRDAVLTALSSADYIPHDDMTFIILKRTG